MQISNTATYSQAHTLYGGIAKAGAIKASQSQVSVQNSSASISYADKVTISSTAKELSAQAERGVIERPVPLPEKPSESDLKSDYIALKKTQYKYQVAADGVNLAVGNSQGLSASSVHYLANNDEARKQSVTVMEAQSQARLAEHYMAQNSEDEQEPSQNTAVVAPYTPTFETALLAASASLLAKYAKEDEVSVDMSKTAA